MDAYDPRLQTFLRVLEAEEKKMESMTRNGRLHGSSPDLTPVPRRMRDSWEKQTWMLNYAARKSRAFDFSGGSFWMRSTWGQMSVRAM